MLRLPQMGSITPRFSTTIRKVDFAKGFADIDVELNSSSIAPIRLVRPKTAEGVATWLSDFKPAEEGRTLRRIKLSVGGDRITLKEIMINSTWYEVHGTTE